jgi:phosphate transport system protein
MTAHLENALDRLRSHLVELAVMAEDQVRSAVAAHENKDKQLAKKVIDSDVLVDKKEVEIEEQVLALYQPVADDLRLVVSILKINNELERAGDYAVTIAERTLYLADQELPAVPIEFQQMSERSIDMLHRSIEAMINRNPSIAREVCRADIEVDRIHHDNYMAVDEMVQKYPVYARFIMQYISISRCLERIADQATNIAEDVIYLVEGRIVRHDASTRGQ